MNIDKLIKSIACQKNDLTEENLEKALITISRWWDEEGESLSSDKIFKLIKTTSTKLLY